MAQRTSDKFLVGSSKSAGSSPATKSTNKTVIKARPTRRSDTPSTFMAYVEIPSSTGSERTKVATSPKSARGLKSPVKSPKSPSKKMRMSSPTGSSGYDDMDVIRNTQFEPKTRVARSASSDDGDVETEDSSDLPEVEEIVRSVKSSAGEKRRRARSKSMSVIEISSDEDEPAPSSPQRTGHDSSDSEITFIGVQSPRSNASNTISTYRAAEAQLRDSDDSDQDEVNVRPVVRRRLRKGSRIEVKEDDNDEGQTGGADADEEDDDDPMDGIDEEHVTENRLRDRSKRSAKESKLDIYKRRRSGIKDSNESEAESESSEESSNPHTIPGMFKGARPSKPSDFEEDETVDESDQDSVGGFIEDDSASATKVVLPAAFSMDRHQDLPALFKIVCQYMVHLAVTKPENRRKQAKQWQKETYFKGPLFTLRNKLGALRDTVAGSRWKAPYKRRLEKFPELQVYRLNSSASICDSCGISTRPAPMGGRLLGNVYDPLTYGMRMESSSDEDEEEEDEYDRYRSKGKGKQKRKKSEGFSCGRVCCNRTQAFHALVHWEYHLFNSLSSQVDRAYANRRQYTHMKKAGNAKPPKETSNADDVMDWLDSERYIEMEWGKIKQMMGQAENVENAKEDDDD